MNKFLSGFIKRKNNKDISKNPSTKKDNGIYALQRSEILDECTCNLCLSMDGLVLSPDDEMTSVDLFHEGCRGIWVEIMKEEIEPPPITGVSDEIRNRFDIKQNKFL